MASVINRPHTRADGSKGDKWTVRWFDQSGKRRSKGFDLKKQADAYMRKVEREIEDGTHVPDAEAATVGDIAKRYLESVAQRVRDGRLGKSRLRDLDVSLRCHILPHLGRKRVRDLIPGDVEDLYRAIIKDGKRGPMSARHACQELGTLESYAYRLGATKTTPVALGLADLRGIKSAPIATLTEEEAARVLRHVMAPRFAIRKRSAALVACAIHLAACCGLRSGEIRALTVDCIDLDAGEVRVRRSLTYYNEVKGPKTAAGNRNVPIPAHLVAMLRRWVETYADANPLGLLFTTIGGQPVKGTILRAMWKTVCIETNVAGGAGVHFHALRHFAASWWIENGVSLPETATMLGHSKVDMTLSVYAHALVRPQARGEAMERMAARLTQIPAAADALVTHGDASA